MDAAVDSLANLASGASAAVADPPDSGAALTLDAALAASASELAGADDDFLDFSDPQAVLDEAPSAPAALAPDLVASASPSPPPAALAAEPVAVTPAATEDDVPDLESVTPSPAADDDLSDFADPATVLNEISAELEAASPADQTIDAPAAPLPEPEPIAAVPAPSPAPTPAGELPVDPPAEPAPALDPEPVAAEAGAEPLDPAPAPPTPGGAIDQLDEVLAAEAEAVLSRPVPTPRVAEPAPEKSVEAAAPAPAKPDAAPSSPAPAAAAKPAAPAPDAPPPAPARKSRLRPLIAGAAARAVRPLVRINTRLSHSTRQTIAWAAVMTLLNATWVWGYVLVRGPQVPPQPTGESARFYKPGDPLPAHTGDAHGPASGEKTEGHGAPASKKNDDAHGAPTKKKDDGHGAPAKKKDDGHGAAAKKKETKSSSAKKKDAKKDAAHH